MCFGKQTCRGTSPAWRRKPTNASRNANGRPVGARWALRIASKVKSSFPLASPEAQEYRDRAQMGAISR